MNKYEVLLFELAPWTQEMMEVSKNLNNASFLRGRTGWLRRNINNPETIYEHACKVGLAAGYLFGTDDAIAQGIIHDHPEIFEPDYIPWEIDNTYKKEKEYQAMLKLKNILPNGAYWFEAWENFENRKGIGLQIVELDKICPSIQAINYLSYYKEEDLKEFYPYARKRVETPKLLNLLDEMCLNNIRENGSAYNAYFRKLKALDINK